MLKQIIIIERTIHVKNCKLFLATILTVALLAAPAFAASGGDAPGADDPTAASDGFVESPVREDDPAAEPSDAPGPDVPNDEAPKSPQTGTDLDLAALLAAAFGAGAAGILIAGGKKEKAD